LSSGTSERIGLSPSSDGTSIDQRMSFSDSYRER